MKPAKPASATMDEQTFIPDTMRALYLASPEHQESIPMNAEEGRQGIEENLSYTSSFPTPKPAPNEYLIKVQTAAFSRDEMRLARILSHTKTIPHIPLHNICGTVISTPERDLYKPGGPKFKVDQVVFGLVGYMRDGGAADYCVATEYELAVKPQNITAAEAATIPLPALTAWQGLFDYAGVKPEDKGKGGLRVLVTNGCESEVGRQALQILRARALFPYEEDSRPWICVTCSNPDGKDTLRDNLHFDEVISAPLPLAGDFDLGDIFRNRGWDPVDIVIDCVGGQMFKQAHLPAVVKDGGVVLTAVDPAPAQEKATDDFALYAKRDLISRYIAARPSGDVLARIGKLVEENSIRGSVGDLVDLIQGPDIFGGGTAGGRGEAVVVKVNVY